MDISTIQSIFQPSPLAVTFWVIAAVVVVVGFAAMFVSATGMYIGLGMVAIGTAMGGFGAAITADNSNVVKTEKFQEELKDQFGVTTKATFFEVMTAAQSDRTIRVSPAGELPFEIEPRLDGATLTFIKADDGSIFAPLNGDSGAKSSQPAAGEVKTSAFHAELKDVYGVETDVTPEAAKNAATEGRTIIVKRGSQMIMVHPVIDGSTFTLIQASDGVELERVGQ